MNSKKKGRFRGLKPVAFLLCALALGALAACSPEKPDVPEPAAFDPQEPLTICFDLDSVLDPRHYSFSQDGSSKYTGAKQRREAVEAYTELYDKAAQARTVCQGAQAAYEAVEATAKANLDQILSQVRAFRPMVRDLADARAAMDEAFVRCGELEQARRKEDEARLRWQTRRDEAPPPAEPVERPQESREELLRRQADTVDRLSALRRRIHTTQGRIQALGDPEDLRSQLRRMEEQYAFLQKEYDAIALATEVLFVASSSLQTRFSPDLGSRAAAIFTKLTKGKYNKVLLDQDLRPSAQETGQFVAHDVPFLSQGAADQLYLAVRLAICDMVLPADRACPVLLDDALVNFDDQRMAAALDYLREEAETRQILLFTCHSREAAYFRDDPAVSIQHLTAPAERV